MKRNRKSGMTRAILCRVGVMLLTLAILGGVLSGCGGCGSSTTTATLTLTKDVIHPGVDSDIITPSADGGNALNREQLLTLAQKIADNAYATEIREKLVAALDGNSTEPDENASEEMSWESALQELNESYKLNANELIKEMTIADLTMLVNSLKLDNGMDSRDLTDLAEEIAANSSATIIREQLVAALRGYDMTAEDFDDGNIDNIQAQPDKAVEYALKVLKSDTYKLDFQEAFESMTRADLNMLIQSFQTAVVLEDDIGFITRILMWIAIAFEWMINTLGFGSFILGTVFFAIAVEIIMLPISIIQQRNARKSARLRPKEMAIRKKYAGRTDQATMQTMQQEIMQMQQNEGVSPMSSGCLPLLISLPIVFALYYVVIDPLKYMMGCSTELASALNTFATTSKAAGGLGLSLQSNRGTIEILSYIREMGVEKLAGLKDFAFFTNSGDCLTKLTGILENHKIPNFNIGPVNFGLTPGLANPWLLLVPALTFGVYFGSSKLTRKMTYQPTTANDPGMGCSNAIMDISMPLMSAIFTFWVPGAVGVYWAIKSVVSLGKQFIMTKVMPLPVFTEADYKAAERELAGKNKNRPVKKSGTRNPNVRSLHHIDDEDFEPGSKATYPTVESRPSSTEPEKANESPYSEGATLKEDVSAEERRAQKKNKKKSKGEDAPANDQTDHE